MGQCASRVGHVVALRAGPSSIAATIGPGPVGGHEDALWTNEVDLGVDLARLALRCPCPALEGVNVLYPSANRLPTSR